MEGGVTREVLAYKENPNEDRKWSVIKKMRNERNRNLLLEVAFGPSKQNDKAERQKASNEVKKRLSTSAPKSLKINAVIQNDEIPLDKLEEMVSALEVRIEKLMRCRND
ncbi:hypothetical protein EIN_390680 [Entamoeba invadens IP1]|uniref:Uncharacterized protein n=1 Tax=Entamoeba invadens IP1 TaxID=370355 RepID=A0A0A1U8N4_ENTIV|nr:hypothetical protein EIN_390680 [Entamoeba invadens IP1]ELP89443.1 hypothetical protein EIN_390680 [Entamoeba invadens IP1]|eukprot:XP_004256214.1 hypothetical protein EIN_390680 [Entamoeba invadens IP1]